MGGSTGGAVDFFDLTSRYSPIVFAFVLKLSFLLLMMVFRYEVRTRADTVADSCIWTIGHQTVTAGACTDASGRRAAG